MSKSKICSYEEIESTVRKVVFSIVKKNPRYQGMVNDLIQEGIIKALEVIDKFNPSKGVSFKTFMSKCVKNEIINKLREESQKGNVLELVEGMEIVDAKSSNYDLRILEKQISTFIESNPSLFSEEDKEIINLRIMGYTYEEIARRIGQNKKYVDNSIQRVKRIIYEKFRL